MRINRLVLSTLWLALALAQGCGRAQPVAPEMPGATSGGEESVMTREVRYSSGTTDLKGFIAYPVTREKRPAVLIVHEWWGLNDYVKNRAQQLASLGYVAMAIDMYGEGKSTTHAEDAKAFATAASSNVDEARKRFMAAQLLLASDARVDAGKLAAIGYCFGGATVLNMARAGSDLRLIASFHGALATPAPMPQGAFGGKLFVAHGAADQFIPPEQVQAFKQEMDAAGADYELVEYADAKHGFTNPDADKLGQENNLPLGYDAQADQASWQRFTELLSQL